MTTVETTVHTGSTTTSLIPHAPNPWTELEKLANRLNNIDYSRLSISHQGIFAVILTNKRNLGLWDIGTFSLWQWDGMDWTDVTPIINNQPDLGDQTDISDGSATGARFVTTYDYTEDGVNDFLVSFDESTMGLNHPLGGVLSNVTGAWWWLSFKDFEGDFTTTMQELNYSTKLKRLHARDYMNPEFPFYDTNYFNWDKTRGYFRGTSSN